MPGLLELVAVAEAAGDTARVGLLLGQDEGDCGAAAPRPAGAAGAVHVALVLFRRIEVDHVGDVVEVEAAGGHVGRDQRRGPCHSRSAASARSRARWDRSPCIATASTPWRASFSTRRSAPRFVRTKTSVRPSAAARCWTSVSTFVSAVTEHEAVLDLARRALGRAAGPRTATGCWCTCRASSPTSPSSVAEKNIVCRLLRQPADDLVDLRQEAHVEHPVGLVEDEDATCERSTRRRCSEILETARRGDQDVRASWRASPGRGAGTPPYDGRDAEVLRAGERLELIRHLDASSRVGTRTSADGPASSRDRCARRSAARTRASCPSPWATAPGRRSRRARRAGRASGCGTASG